VWEFEPKELVGRRVVLRPLRPEHARGLLAAADHDEVFTWLPFPRFMDLDEVDAWIEAALDERQRGRRIPFVVEQTADGALVGSTSLRNLDTRNRGVEVGSTWISRAAWGVGANPESKLLLMGFAFESLGLERVFLRADNLNRRAQVAHENLGAVREGIHRHEVLRRDGSWCDSIHYSVLRGEWPQVRRRLLMRLDPGPNGLQPSSGEAP